MRPSLCPKSKDLSPITSDLFPQIEGSKGEVVCACPKRILAMTPVCRRGTPKKQLHKKRRSNTVAALHKGLKVPPVAGRSARALTRLSAVLLGGVNALQKSNSKNGNGLQNLNAEPARAHVISGQV
jgi:hypothetical protein